MRFVTFLNSGGSVQAAAATEFAELQLRSDEAGELCLEITAEFISECLRAIGFSYTLTVQQLEEDAAAIEWPAEAQIYIFTHNSLMFTPFEQFLVELCAQVQEKQEQYMRVRDSQTEAEATAAEATVNLDEHDSPLDLLMELFGLWCRVYRQLVATSCRFEEPLARINYHMLLGMHRLRLIYRTEYTLIDAICNRLYSSALQGLYYCETNHVIATGLMDMFEKDYEFFYRHEPAFINFYFEIFDVEHQKKSYYLAFKSLEKLLLLPSGATPQTTLTDFLIETRMQRVYFETIKEEKTKRLLLATLNFLRVLHKKLLDVGCLALELITRIQDHIFNADSCISSLASELYIAHMQRRLSDDKSILQHILECFVYRAFTPSSMALYVNSLWPHFPYMQTIDVYLDIITNENTERIMRFICAQFLKIVYNQMLQKIEKYQHDIEHLLKLLPEVLKMTKHCNKTSGIILGIFVSSDLELLQRKLPSFLPLINSFEKFASQTLTHATNYEYPILLNLFNQINRCLRFTQKYHRIEQSGAEICRQYFRIEKELTQLTVEQPNAELLNKYRTVLQKINLLLKFNFDLINSLPKLCNTLKTRLIDTTQIYEIVQQNNSFLDLYAVGILTSATIKSLNNAEFSDVFQTAAEKQNAIKFASQLLRHLLQSLRKMLEMDALPAVRIAVVFIALIDLYCAFPATSAICCLLLTSNDYNLLIETLLQLNFSTNSKSNRHLKTDDGGDEETQMHPNWIFGYQCLMLRKFTQLHACAQLEIPSRLSWKLCIYYGLPQHKFNAELDDFILTLATQRFAIYKHIGAVLVYNLHKRRPELNDRTILKAIQAHNTFINKQLGELNPPLIKVHIVLLVLAIIAKSLSVVSIKADQNRLLALKHLHVFIEDLTLSTDNVLPDILQQADLLHKHLLNAAEIRQLDTFTKFCKKHNK